MSITTSAVNFAVPGSLGLTVIADSEGDPAVQASTSADLTIADTTGLTASFSPASQTLSAPGMASFILNVNNTGNTEDAYSATITGSNGPVTATLMGLDGQPTQSISEFNLPGLSSGAILLQANLASLGTGAVTVQVQSLDNEEEQPVDNTAMVSAAATVAAPTLTNINPASATVGDAATVITLTGTNFAEGFTADFNGRPLTTTFVTSTELTAVIPASDLTTAGTDSITVVSTDASATAPLTFTVNNPVPTLTSINPTSVTTGGPDTNITLSGTGFVNGSTADFNGTPIATTFVNSTQLTAVVPASDLAAASADSITVTTGGPGGGASAPLTFTVNAVAPPPAPPPITPRYVSVAFGPFGEVVEVVNSAGVLTQFSAAGVQVLGGGVRCASIAYGRSGAVIEVVSTAGILVQFDASGHQQLGGAGVESASVAFGPDGEVLDVVLIDGSVRQFSAAGVQELGTNSVVSASVAFGPGGVTVEILNTASVVTQFVLTGHQQLGGAGVLSAGVAFSPTGTEVLDIIFSDGSLDQFDAFGQHYLG